MTLELVPNQLGTGLSNVFCFGVLSAFGIIHKLMSFDRKSRTAAAMLLL
jgi:hypothetical protein